jgi:urease accessory protein
MLDLLLADARTPSGGFAHSGGVEPARLALDEVPRLLEGRLATVGLVDAAVAAAAARGDDPQRLEDAWCARTPAPALRAAARRQGRALLRVAAAVRPGALDGYASASSETPRPVVLGLLGRHLGLAPARVAEICLYDDAATGCAAVPKLYAVDAVEVTRWLAELMPLIERLARQAVAAERLPAAAAPLLELRAQAHASEPGRLFVT